MMVVVLDDDGVPILLHAGGVGRFVRRTTTTNQAGRQVVPGFDGTLWIADFDWSEVLRGA